MTWNYRIVERDDTMYPWFELRECYYDNEDTSNPHMWTANAALAGAETAAELRAQLAHMLEAFEKPPLKMSKLEAAARKAEEP